MVRNVLVPVDVYQDMDQAMKERLKWMAAEIKKNHEKSIEVLFQTAQVISDAHKDLAGTGRDGMFAAWVKQELPFSLRTAYNFLNVHRLALQNSAITNLSDKGRALIDQTAYYELSKPDTPKRLINAAAKSASKGEKVTADDVKKLRKKVGLWPGTKNGARSPQPNEAETEESDEEHGGEEPHDCAGNKLPERLVDVFEFRAIMKSQVGNLSYLMSWVQESKSDPATSAVLMDQLYYQLRDAKESLSVGLPYATCPYCHGNGCQNRTANRMWCEGRGWLTKDQWNAIHDSRQT